MSIQSEITRIINYRDLSFEACREKGVSVPTTAIIDDLPGYIAQISGEQVVITETQDPHGGTVVTITGGVVSLQSKTATPSETAQTISPDAGYRGMSEVIISAIPSTYVGSGVERRDDSDLTASGATVTVPAGYYADDETKSVASGSASTPATTITANPSISVNSSGLITATASGSRSITPTVSAGYVSSGTAGTVSVSGSNTQQLTTQAAKTVTPTKSSQQAVASGVYTTGAVTVAAIPAEYITTTDATAAAGDIVSGETAYVNGSKVTGSLVIQHYYTGSSEPSASTGSDGDIYLRTGG